MIKVDLPSGAVLDITLLPYEQAWGICQAITRTIEKLDVDLKDVDLKNWQATDLIALKGPLCAILCSTEIVEAAKVCFERCTYNKLRIDSMTFEKRENRKDYLPASFHAIKENIAPFFENLLSFLPKH